MMLKKLLLPICLACIVGQISAQEISSDTAFLTSAAGNAKKMLYKSKALQSHLYNGVSYVEPRTTHADKFPQYTSNEWTSGSIDYDGEMFENVGLLYDIYTDDIIVEMPSTGAAVKLIREKVKSFKIYDLQFVRLTGPGSTPWFYGELYKGTTSAYARFEKNKQERIEQNEVNVDYELKTKYYILKNGVFYNVSSKSDVYKILSDKKNELKQFARNEKMKFRKNKQQSLIKLVTFYDTIQP